MPLLCFVIILFITIFFASFYGIHLRAAKFRSMEEIVREEKRFRSVIYSDNSYQCYH